MKGGNGSSVSFYHFSMMQSISEREGADFRAEVLGDRDDQSWYLVYLGTRPSARGKGYARRLVEYITNQVSRIGMND
jgi:GNAT superfamily N-acetyltransferase